MAEDDFPTRLAAALDDDGAEGAGLPKPSRVAAGVLADLRGTTGSGAGDRFERESIDRSADRYSFVADAKLADTACTARIVIYREDGHVYARHGVHPPSAGGLLSRLRGRTTGYDALGIDPSDVRSVVARRMSLVENGVVDRVVSVRSTDDPVGFELRFETADTSMLTTDRYDDGRDYLHASVPALAARAIRLEKELLG